MNTLIVAEDGQATLGSDILEHLGVGSGDKISIEKLSAGRIAMKASRPTENISDVFGSLKRSDGPCLSIEEMNQIAAQGWAGNRKT